MVPTTFNEQLILHDKIIQLKELRKYNLIDPNTIILDPPDLFKYTNQFI